MARCRRPGFHRHTQKRPKRAEVEVGAVSLLLLPLNSSIPSQQRKLRHLKDSRDVIPQSSKQLERLAGSLRDGTVWGHKPMLE